MRVGDADAIRICATLPFRQSDPGAALEVLVTGARAAMHAAGGVSERLLALLNGRRGGRKSCHSNGQSKVLIVDAHQPDCRQSAGEAQTRCPAHPAGSRNMKSRLYRLSERSLASESAQNIARSALTQIAR